VYFAGGVDLQVTGVRYPHVYFEYTAMGFAEGGLKELGGQNVRMEKVPAEDRAAAPLRR